MSTHCLACSAPNLPSGCCSRYCARPIPTVQVPRSTSVLCYMTIPAREHAHAHLMNPLSVPARVVSVSRDGHEPDTYHWHGKVFLSPPDILEPGESFRADWSTMPGEPNYDPTPVTVCWRGEVSK